MQNDATGCGNIFHSRQIHFWKVNLLTLFGPTFFRSRFRAQVLASRVQVLVSRNPPRPSCRRMLRLQLGHSGLIPAALPHRLVKTQTQMAVRPPISVCQSIRHGSWYQATMRDPSSGGMSCQSTHPPARTGRIFWHLLAFPQDWATGG